MTHLWKMVKHFKQQPITPGQSQPSITATENNSQAEQGREDDVGERTIWRYLWHNGLDLPAQYIISCLFQAFLPLFFMCNPKAVLVAAVIGGIAHGVIPLLSI